jgi:ADP-ribosyl-[dinitrogen reductase] hydrolase
MDQDQAIGAIIGLAVGDALGTTLEFTSNPTEDRSQWHTEITGGGPFSVPVGGWTDDTSMALALGYAYKSKKGFDAELISSNFLAWWLDGEYSWANKCIDIGGATLSALTRLNNLKQGESHYQGSTSPNSSGNGGIMRLAPSVVSNARNLDLAVEQSVLQSRITHASEECCLYSDLLARVLYAGDPFIKEVEDHILSDSTPWSQLPSSGYVKDTFQCAMWAARNSDSFEECLLLAVNRRGDADTIGAVSGQIAGAMYGYKAIPERWRKVLVWRDQMIYLATCLYDLGVPEDDFYQQMGESEKQIWDDQTVKLDQFLNDNVAVYSTPKEVTISQIKVDWSQPGISGTFVVALDQVVLIEPIRFSIGQNGKPNIYLPMFHSPCGVPCSYNAIELTELTIQALRKLLTNFFPAIKPCNALGGSQGISYTDGLFKRTNPSDYAKFLTKLKKPHQLIMEVEE